MQAKFIVSDPEKCTGCGICELVCSATKEKAFNPILSRIRAVRVEPFLYMAIACRLCENPKCVRSCPRKALRKDETTGLIRVDTERCDGCKWCIEACEFGAIFIHPQGKIAMVCDLCDGEPKCVPFCPREALELMTSEQLAQRFRKKALLKLLSENLKAIEK